MNDALSIARVIDHTLLRLDATEREVAALCREAIKYSFFSVCVNPWFVPFACRALEGSSVRITTVIGFPLGMTLSRVKVYESMEAAVLGADELDVVINLAMAKTGRWDLVKREIGDIMAATAGAVHKVIVEACYLSEEEKKEALAAVLSSGALFIKTSTGFGPGGAKTGDVRLFQSLSRGRIGIKAAGGIRTLESVKEFIAAGATRIGTSAGTRIMSEIGGDRLPD